MCDPGTLILVAAAAQIAGTVTKTVGAVTQAKYESNLANYNRKLEGEKAADAIERGNVAARDAARRQSALVGAQRASLAANGVDLSYGTPGDLLSDSAMLGQDQQIAVRENTRREVMGYDINSANFGAQASAAKGRIAPAIIGGVFEVAGTAAGAAQRYGDRNKV